MLFAGLLFSVLGLWASWKIYRSKRLKKGLICPLRASCDKVLHSHYATTLGVPNEIIGIGYFTFVGLVLALLRSGSVIPGAYTTLLVVTTVGIVFSFYLIFVQLVSLRAWCSWCMLIALSNIVLWFCIHTLVTPGVYTLLVQTKSLWTILYTVGFLIAIGAVTIIGVLFFHFLEHFKMGAQEKGRIDELSHIVLVGSMMLVVSGYLLFLPQRAELLVSPLFILKLIIIASMLISTVVLYLRIIPVSISISFEELSLTVRRRRIAFALSAISLTSWYSAALLELLQKTPFTFFEGLIMYLIVVGIAIAVSQFFEERIPKETSIENQPARF